ncbi:hypothetical protein [Flavihumibacter petaseus]|uniref:Uncharacterized protein n=1 Tax=Flavihumibacter petaseus NBRC 106054 TaxID=1220578 RepID=A0A0E9N048_9BACT|nr:hypothetical protein [Flavihumibacter petaseus]GAO42996.1 hypothetical protein FPE01S_02_01010 [Flavihumibacter petaseus NBRC 106054]
MRSFLLCIALLAAFCCFSQQKAPALKSHAGDPVIFVDSVRTSMENMKKVNAEDIARINVYKDSSAVRLLGQEGRYGAVYIETNTFIQTRYWSLFSLISLDYARAVPTPACDTAVAYQLNNTWLTRRPYTDLSALHRDSIHSIKIIDSTTLVAQFRIQDKKHGVMITTRH